MSSVDFETIKQRCDELRRHIDVLHTFKIPSSNQKPLEDVAKQMMTGNEHTVRMALKEVFSERQRVIIDKPQTITPTPLKFTLKNIFKIWLQKKKIGLMEID